MEFHHGVYTAQPAWISSWCVQSVRTHYGAIRSFSLSQVLDSVRGGRNRNRFTSGVDPLCIDKFGSCVVVGQEKLIGQDLMLDYQFDPF